MSFSTTLYNTIFRRNSVFVGTIFFSAFFVDMGLNKAVDSYFAYVNRGKLWQDIRGRFITADDDEDDE